MSGRLERRPDMQDAAGEHMNGAAKTLLGVAGVVMLLGLTGCLYDPPAPESGRVALGSDGVNLLVGFCDAVEITSLYVDDRASEGIVSYTGAAVIQRDRVIQLGTSVDGLRMVRYEQFPPASRGEVWVFAEGAHDFVSRTFDLRRTNLVAGMWLRWDGSLEHSACE